MFPLTHLELSTNKLYSQPCPSQCRRLRQDLRRNWQRSPLRCSPHCKCPLSALGTHGVKRNLADQPQHYSSDRLFSASRPLAALSKWPPLNCGFSHDGVLLNCSEHRLTVTHWIMLKMKSPAATFIAERARVFVDFFRSLLFLAASLVYRKWVALYNLYIVHIKKIQMHVLRNFFDRLYCRGLLRALVIPVRRLS